MNPRDRRRRALLILALTALLADCQDAHVRFGGSPSSVSPAPVASAPSSRPPNPGNIPGGEVRVLRGETIYDVSQRTGAPVRDLIDANNLQPPYRLANGRMLIVPRTPTHAVRRGETLYSIASAEGVDLYSLARMNELTPPFAVTPGQVLKLPPRVAQPLMAASPPPAPPPGKPDIGVTALAPVTTQPIAPPASSPSVAPPPVAKPGVASLPHSPAPGPEAAGTEVPPPSHAGRFLWPVHGTIIARFGTEASGIHSDGINIAAPKGTPVRAADSGVVAYAGNELRGYGNLILIKHPGGWMTAYAHNEVLLVKRGEVVKRGQEIAKVGATGIASQPQLYFEIRRGTEVLDPMQYLAASQASAVR